MPRLVVIALLLVCSSLYGADAVRLVESAPAGAEYRVITEFTFTGELMLPVEKGKPPEKVKMNGQSSIDYAERILKVDPKEADHVHVPRLSGLFPQPRARVRGARGVGGLTHSVHWRAAP